MKYFGKIGFNIVTEEAPGKWMPSFFERKYTGEVIRHSQRYDFSSNGSNVTSKITDEISIMSDRFMQEHLSGIRYITLGGSKWEIANISISDMPRIKFTLGGLYKSDESEQT